MFLLEKSPPVVDERVVEGQTTFCNMLKYIRMTASSNFGDVLSVCGLTTAMKRVYIRRFGWQ